MKKTLSTLLLISLTACTGSEVKSTLGLKKRAPDEFMVLSRPALTVPPSFELPAPESQAGTPKDFSANNAKQALFGTTATKPARRTNNAENVFLSKAGAAEDQSNIRALIEEDIRAQEAPLPPEEKGFFSRFFSPIELEDKPDPVVNPAAEKERIKESAARGEKIDGSDTLTIQPKGESVLDRIF